MIRQRIVPSMFAFVALAALAGCQDKPSASLAPTATALAAEKPATEASKKFAIDKESAKVDFLMEAPVEKIRGRIDKAAEGELAIDLMDVAKTVGIVRLDISGIEVFQTKADDKGQFGQETKSDVQNEHVKAWLEIGPKADEAKRKENARVEFAIKKVSVKGDANVMKGTGAERKVALTAEGDFLLHGHKTMKTAELEATFTFEGDKPVAVHIKSTKPFAVGLEENDVRPRDTLGSLLAKGLDALSAKVAKEALVSVDLTAKLAN